MVLSTWDHPSMILWTVIVLRSGVSISLSPKGGTLTVPSEDGKNHACGEDSDCINRATKMECVDGDCNCGVGCQNQRFQRKQYASVSVIKT